MNKFLTQNLIDNRINNFLGYGNLKGDIWFIGMEEGSSNKFEELYERFNKTYNKEIIDLRDLDIAEHQKWFEKDLPPIQKTWNILIQILLKLENNTSNSLIERKKYQKYNLGSINQNHCLIELSSLPSTSTKDWVYNNYSEIEYLSSREQYLKQIIPIRIKLISKKIIENQPKLVIFYSKSYTNYWEQIIKLVNNEKIKFHIIPHPTSQGMSNKDWQEIFEEIKINN